MPTFVLWYYPISEKAVQENKSDVPGYLELNYALFKFGDGLNYK